MDAANLGELLLASIKRIRAVYESYLEAVSGIFVKHIASIESVQSNPQTYFKLHTQDIQNQFAAQLSVIVHDEFEKSLKSALRASQEINFNNNEYESYKALVIQHLVDKIVSQMRSDRLQFADRLHRFSIKVFLLSRQEGEAIKHAIVSERERTFGDLRTNKTDTMGRKRSSKDFVAVETHSSLFRFVNTVVTAQLISAGHKEANLHYDKELPVPFEIGRFEDVLATLHPRSLALVMRV